MFLLPLLSVRAASDGSERIQFEIPPSPAHQALNLFARQADIQLLYPYDLMEDLQLDGLLGRFTVEEGVKHLISGTCLELDISTQQNLILSANNRGFWFMKRNNCNKSSILSKLSAAFVAGISASAVNAQDMPSTAMLEEIIVTATRRSESLQSVPITVSAQTAVDLSRAGVEGIPDLALTTPGLNVTQRSAYWTPTIRGVGTLDVSAGQESAIATYVDNIYLPSAISAPVFFNNIERIEVLKGPQGILFGRNATGGLIHVITKDPGQEPTVSGRVSAGNFQTFEADLYATTGLTDKLAADIAINSREQGEGYGKFVNLDKDIPGQDVKAIRSKWLYTPTDSTKITFIGDYWQRQGSQGDTRAIERGSLGFGTYPALSNFQASQSDLATEMDVEDWGFSLQLEHNYENHNLVSITSYRENEASFVYDNDGTPDALIHVNAFQTSQTFTQEIRFQGLYKERVNWVLGGFYLADENQYDNPRGLNLSGGAFPDPLTGNPASVAIVNGIKTSSWSLFGDATIDLTERLHLSLGARWIDDTKEISGRTDVFLENGDIFISLPTPSDKLTTGEPTWRLVLAYDVNDDTMIYGSYNRGFRSGTFNTVEPGPAVEPEKIDSFEAGIKTELLDNRLRLNGAVFYYEYTDMQVTISRGTTQEVVNAGKAQTMGIEAESQLVLNDNLLVSFGATYLDAEYKEFPETGCTIRSPEGLVIGITCNPSGNDMIKAPKLSYNIGAVFTLARTERGEFGGSFNYFWTDDFSFEPDGRLTQEAYGLLNGRLSWSSPEDQYVVSLFGRNLTDKEYSSFKVGQALVGDQYAPSPPRTFGIEFRFDI